MKCTKQLASSYTPICTKKWLPLLHWPIISEFQESTKFDLKGNKPCPFFHCTLKIIKKLIGSLNNKPIRYHLCPTTACLCCEFIQEQQKDFCMCCTEVHAKTQVNHPKGQSRFHSGLHCHVPLDQFVHKCTNLHMF